MSSGLALLFPGQGSQSVGMARDLVARYDVARAVFEEADDVLGFALGRLCFEGPQEELTRTENAQPALVAAGTAVARVVESELGLTPTWAAGHSLGEFSALVCAGSLTFADALHVVRERGRAMQEAVPVGVGAMAAIIGLELAEVDQVCREAAADEVVSPANLNGGGQIVIAGHAAAVDRAATLAKERGARRALRLDVSAPFHCALMAPAAERLRAALAPIPFAPLRFPVFSNVEARAYPGPDRVADLLVRQVTEPVRWQESVEALAGAGCELAVESGPGKVLSGLVRRIAPSIRCLPGENPELLREQLEG